eukprot:c23205_g1_i2 orf=244-939(+)
MGIPVPSVGNLEAVLFDVDGTLCDSDPLHFMAFREMLQEIGFQEGVPINEDFFMEYISGKHNSDIGISLFPDWDQSMRDKFLDDKEARFRSLAVQLLRPVEGLETLCKWIKDRGLKRAAVTNAPPENAKLMISLLGLTDFFELVVLGSECERPKPYPHPYLEALKCLGVSSDQAFAFEDSASGLKAAVGAGLAGIGVMTRNPEDGLLEAGATLIVQNFNDPKLWNALEGQS